MLEWGAVLFSRRSSQPRDWTRVSCIAHNFYQALALYWPFDHSTCILHDLTEYLSQWWSQTSLILYHNLLLLSIMGTHEDISFFSLLDCTGSLVAAWGIFSCGLPGSSAGKESACNAGDPSSIPGLGRSSGEGIGYPVQYSWASLVTQLVKNLPAMCEIWVQSMGWNDPLEKGKTTYSSILAWRISWAVWSLGLQRVGHDWWTFTFTECVLSSLY